MAPVPAARPNPAAWSILPDILTLASLTRSASAAANGTSSSGAACKVLFSSDRRTFSLLGVRTSMRRSPRRSRLTLLGVSIGQDVQNHTCARVLLFRDAEDGRRFPLEDVCGRFERPSTPFRREGCSPPSSTPLSGNAPQFFHPRKVSFSDGLALALHP